MLSAEKFIQSSTTVATPYLVPEIQLNLAAPHTPLWVMTVDRLKTIGLPPPYWAIAWPGGQGMARYILDHPLEFLNQRVLDYGAGSGLAAIAAARVGAQSVLAVDIDPIACEAIQLNAKLSQVTVRTLTDLNLGKAPTKFDVIIAGDICYEQAMSFKVNRWFVVSQQSGIRVLLADPGRAYVPKVGMIARNCYKIPTPLELEEMSEREVTIWEMISEINDLE